MKLLFGFLLAVHGLYVLQMSSAMPSGPDAPTSHVDQPKAVSKHADSSVELAKSFPLAGLQRRAALMAKMENGFNPPSAPRTL